MSDANYYLGIDGGGTKTAFCLIDQNKNILKEVVGKASSIDTVSLLEAGKVFQQGVLDLHFDGQFAGVFAGIGGISSDQDKSDVEKILQRLKGVNNKTICKADNDVVNALLGSVGSSQGICIIIGTGSVAFGMNGDQSWRCGGYSAKEGDPGSAYDLGMKALQYLARVIDGRYQPSSFSKALLEQLNISTFSELAHVFNTYSRTDIANLAKIVTANQDNEYAAAIISTGVDEVVAMIKTVYKKLGFQKAKLGVVGSLGKAPTLYATLFNERINALGCFEIQDLETSASYGAAMKAWEIGQ